MKHLSAPFTTKLIAAAACALTLVSCNRSEYAMLPKASAYHDANRVVAPEPIPTAAVAPAPAVAAETAEKTAISAPTAAAPARASHLPATSATSAAPPATIAAPAAAPRKLNLVQRLAVNKVVRQLDKKLDKATLRQRESTASTAARGSGISGNLRTGIILLLVGLLVGLLNGLIGTIIAIIGLIFIVLWLLDSI